MTITRSTNPSTSDDPLLARQTDSIGGRIRFARKQAGLSQSDLSERLSVSQPTVANWETGVHDPRQLMLAKIAEALQVQLSWLASGERSQTERDKHAAAAYLRRGLYHVPVLDKADAAKMIDGSEIDPHRMAADYIPVTSGSDKLFALFVDDDAMNQEFPGNTLAVIDYNHRMPSDGDTVYFLHTDGRALLRRWRSSPCRLEPYSSDPSHETLYVERLERVIGIVTVTIRWY
ncbi:MAG: XRE family transcriptional regulator [bacterium]